MILSLKCPNEDCEHDKFELYAGDGRTGQPFENVVVRCVNCSKVFIPTYEDWAEDEFDVNKVGDQCNQAAIEFQQRND